LSSNYYRRGRNPTTALGILFIVIGVIAAIQQLLVWSPDFFVDFLLNNEITNEKVSVITICIGVIIVLLGLRKHEQKR
jgi:hypothetical protein